MVKRIISIISVLVILFSILPQTVVFGAVSVPKSGRCEFLASNYSKAYDVSKTSDRAAIEGGNVSFNTGDWIEYDLSIAAEGKYLITFGTKAPSGSSADFELRLDGETISTFSTVPGKGWDVLVKTEFGPIELKKGKCTLRVIVKKGGLYFYDITISPDGSQVTNREDGPYKDMVLPTIIEAENFDSGDGGAFSIDGKNDGMTYRKNEKVNIYAASDNEYYVSLYNTESTTYTFDAPKDGAYTLYLSGGAVGSAEVYFDNAKAPVVISGDGSKEEAQKACIYLKKGTHKMKLLSVSDPFTFDYIRFSHGGDNPIIPGELEPEDKNDVIVSDGAIYKTLWVSPDGSDDAEGSENAPFKTIKRAKDELVNITPDMTGDIIINIKPGEYFIDETLDFTNEHGGKNGYNVIIRGYNKLSKPLLSGGEKIENWEKQENGIWTADVKADLEYMRQLYVDGQPAVRARSKYSYEVEEMYTQTKGEGNGFTVSKANFPEISKPSELETIWLLTWTTARLPVMNISEQGDNYVFHMNKLFDYKWGTQNIELARDKFILLENAKELLDEPGEFYFDKDEKKIYYYPYKEQNMETAEVFAPVTEYAVTVDGNSILDKVENITFDNLEFKYFAWNFPSYHGKRGSQATDCIIVNEDGTFGKDVVGAQVAVNRAKNINITNSVFTCLGGTAINMVDAVCDSKIDGNIFANLGGSGVGIGTFNHNNLDPLMEQCNNITVSNNLIRRIGLEDYGSLGIMGYYENNISILHNDIADVPYTGISYGWGWGSASVKVEWENATISYNKIYDVQKTSRDGGHIYTLGNMPGTEIAYNYLIKSGDSRGGLYNDSGSGNIELHHNVIENTGRWWLQGAYYTKNLNGHDNYSQLVYMSQNSEASNTRQSEVVEKGHKVVHDAKWTGEAAEIVENAGLEPSYRHLLEEDEVSFPEWLKNPVLGERRETFEVSSRDWIQAENFIVGGEGVGYHKHTPRYASAYRPQEAVELETSGVNSMEYYIAVCFGGEWMNYDVEVPEDGEYAFDVRGATHWGDCYVNIYVDGEKVVSAGTVKDNDNRGHYRFPISRVGKAHLTKGKHLVKVEFHESSFYFDAFAIRPADEPATYDEDVSWYDEGVMVSQEEFEAQNQKWLDEFSFYTYDWKDESEKLSFSDTKNHWSDFDVTSLARLGLIKGVGENNFAPDMELTEKQAALLVLRALHLIDDETESDWESKALENELIKSGVNHDRIITRQEYAKMLTKAIIYKTGDVKVTVGNTDFKDAGAIDEEYSLDVLAVSRTGLMTGDEKGCFNPGKSLTRAEAATTIRRLIYM